MGVRFACHLCGKRLHVKAELAGKRGICPACNARFRIPNQDAERSVRPTGLLECEPEAAWYVRPPSGGQYGPASSELLRRWIEEHRVAAAALLWREGWHQWRVAVEALPELADQLPNNDVAGTRSPLDDSSGAAPTVASQSTKRRPVQDPSSHQRQAVATAEARLRGRWDVGAARRGRMIRRMIAVGMLFAVSLALIAVLVFVAFFRESPVSP